MPLPAGARLGPYEILAAIGAGGMGEVYKARDTRLSRTVAIKVLPSDTAGNPDLRSRFEREARAVAALDHPHICGIYDVGSVDGTHYLVMPHLEGQTLAARLEKGPLPLDQALKIAAEIADALDKAHRHGIVHRDLKPANIMLTRSGSKLLDFGLAKLTAPTGPISMSAMTQMATAAPATAQGLILGTVQYMAPEQVEGKEADARSDIWALGAVLYEMVTGTRPFRGDTPASVIGAILKDHTPLISASQPLAPHALDHLVSTCLAKEPDQRWQSVADIVSMLSWIGQTMRNVVTVPGERSRLRPLAGWMIAALLLVALGFAVARPRRIESPDAVREPIMFDIYPPPGRVFAAGGASVPAPQLAVSPDGRHLVFVAAEPQGQPFLWLRTLTDKESRRLPGTEGAEGPFWAPDSGMVGFFAHSAIKKLDIRGSASPETIGPATTDMRGGTWSPSGVVVYSSPTNDGLLKMRATGGDRTTVDFKDSQVAFHTARWPFFLPDGDRFLFLVRDEPERRGIYLGSLAGPVAKRVVGYDWSAQFANGHLFGLRGSALMAQPFDPISGKLLNNSPTTIVEQVAGSSAGYGSFSVSTTGVLAYSRGFLPATELRWVDRSGRATAPVTPVGDYVDLRLSPEESRVAFSRTDPRNQAPDVWVWDLTRGTGDRVASDTLTDSAPLWSPSGDQLIFRSNRGNGIVELYQTLPIAGTDVVTVYSMEQVRLTHGAIPSNLWPTDWSPDGRFIIYQVSLGGTGIDIWALPLVGERKPVPIARAQHNELQGYISPNGRWLAYTSDESGQYEIYVQSFPDASTGGKITISNGGGTQPRWSRNGRELFYLRSDGTLMAVPVKTQPTFEPSTATPLFKTTLPTTTMNAYRMDYVPAADGQRFLMKIPVENTSPPSITVVLNWPSLIKK